MLEEVLVWAGVIVTTCVAAFLLYRTANVAPQDEPNRDRRLGL